MHLGHSTTVATAADLAVSILQKYANADHGSQDTCRHDSGPMVLAAVADSLGLVSSGLALRVARRWLNESPKQIHAVGSFGGLGGFLAGVRAGTFIDEDFIGFSDSLVNQVPTWLGEIEWRTSLVAWHDYDLFKGPAGLVLAGASSSTPTAPFARALHHLALLCDDTGLERLRAGTEIDPRSAFNIGRINTGMGHGVTGVAAALRHAAETFEDGSCYFPALTRACAWLVEEAYLADGDFITWPPVGRDGTPALGTCDRRQAWCYGTPGVAWTLWDAGRVLEDSSLQDLAEEAMRSFCRVFDVELHIDKHNLNEALGVCHGAAGTLAVADAFARHSGLREAASLREYLDSYLVNRVDQIVEIAKTDVTMLNGAGGIVSVMLTAGGGARGWLPQLALR